LKSLVFLFRVKTKRIFCSLKKNKIKREKKRGKKFLRKKKEKINFIALSNQKSITKEEKSH
jgi:hypothetical protein